MVTFIVIAVICVLAARLVLRTVGRVRATYRKNSRWIWIGVAVVVAISFAAYR